MDLLARLRRRSKREWLATAFVGGGLAGFVILVYVVVVVVGGAVLTGGTSEPTIGFSVLATAVVALAFDPVQSRLEELASKVVHGGRASPYDVLRSFAGTATGGHAAEELPPRMARVLAEGTGAEWAQVWLVVDDRPALAATWPPAAPVPATLEEDRPGRRSLTVGLEEEELGVLVLQERPEEPLTSIEERLFAGLAAQSRLVLRGARLRAELTSRAAELSSRVDELRASRQRLVDAQDSGRRRLERDIHDGAQQHLVALAVNLRLAASLARTAPERAVELLADQTDAARDAVDTLVRLSRGIYPPLLADRGLPAALRDAVRTSPVPVEITAGGVGRFPPGVEAAAYFCCLEALQNAVKHAEATAVELSLADASGNLTFVITDNGAGFDSATTPAGTGLANMRDRLESVNGTLSVDSVLGGGTTVTAEVPGSGG